MSHARAGCKPDAVLEGDAKPGAVRSRGDGGTEPHGREDGIEAGSVIRLHGMAHRIVAHVGSRVLATDLRLHVPYLIQERPDGPLVLPSGGLLLAMLADGRATRHDSADDAGTPTERMRAQIEMLDAAGVPQGEKAIWIHLARHWTPDLAAAFGEHDDPCKIKRWRAALRRAAR